MAPYKLLRLESPKILPFERRREWRESLRVAVEVSGFDVRGRFFTERTSTLDASDSGCCFLLSAEVETNSAVSVRVVRRRDGMVFDGPPVLFRVVWLRQTQPGWPKWTVAATLSQPVELQSAGFPVESAKQLSTTNDVSRANSSAAPDDEPPPAA